VTDGGAGTVSLISSLDNGINESTGTIIAGTRGADGFADSTALVRRAVGRVAPPPSPTNTTLVAVVTNARLDKVALSRLARQAHDGLALAISPVHTSVDGDCVFALSTGDVPANPDALAVLAVELTAAAIRRAVRQATTLHSVPAVHGAIQESSFEST